jgi:hypothetical protein
MSKIRVAKAKWAKTSVAKTKKIPVRHVCTSSVYGESEGSID